MLKHVEVNDDDTSYSRIARLTDDVDTFVSSWMRVKDDSTNSRLVVKRQRR